MSAQALPLCPGYGVTELLGMSAGEHCVEDPAAARPRCPGVADEVVEWLVSCGPGIGMKPEHEERERAIALAKAV